MTSLGHPAGLIDLYSISKGKFQTMRLTPDELLNPSELTAYTSPLKAN